MLVQTSWFFIAALIAIVMAPRVDAVAPGLGAMKYLAGLVFAVLLYLSVLLHEAAHAIAAKRFGLPTGPITLHFLGGMTEIRKQSKTPGQEFVIAVVGPLTSIAVGAAALAVIIFARPPGLLGLAFDGLASANLIVGAFNLVPGLPLDGGRVLQSLVWKITGDRDKALWVAAWGGRISAVLIILIPVLLLRGYFATAITDLVILAFVAFTIWGGASAALRVAQVRRTLPKIDPGALARPVIAVPDDLSIAEAVRRARDQEVGAILTHTTDGEVTGIVSEFALGSVPEERRPWEAVSTVARRLTDEITLPASISGEELLRVLGTAPSPEYLLVDDQRTIVGVLVTNDIEAALAGLN